MKLTELLPVPVLEYGRHGFPGYSRRIFSQRFYEYMVTQLVDIDDEHAKQWLTDWLSTLFHQDNSKFSPQRFAAAVAAGKRYNAQAPFQQRHLYYLAQHVKEITDPHIHQFVASWLADVVGRTNNQFKRQRWDQHTARPAEPEAEPEPAV